MKSINLFIKVNLILLFNILSGNNLFSSETGPAKITQPNRLAIGGYGQIDASKSFGRNEMNNAVLDIHRLIVIMNYKFNQKLRLFTEIELEHVSEVYVEQAYLNYRFSNLLNIRGGLILVPMGIINEYHEPNTFNGVLRPLTDKIIIPSTWREIGVGITGLITSASINYQLFLVNGFNSYTGAGTLNGTNGFRKARQKGAESIMTSPNFAGKVSYFGVPQLKLNISAFIGKTESELFNNLNKANTELVARADSSIVGIQMFTGSMQYKLKNLYVRGQYSFVNISNSYNYNAFTGNDLGSAMTGYYAELGYNLLKLKTKDDSELIPFIRFTQINTHKKVERNTLRNKAYKVSQITMGIGYKITPLAMIKTDIQFVKNGNDANYANYTVNVGLGFSF
ncbi:MAG: hypothetical protein GXO79_05955 [Chlorobi bacterium]|nr:hypothetical protein [Chlorobiota bacterium]